MKLKTLIAALILFLAPSAMGHPLKGKPIGTTFTARFVEVSKWPRGFALAEEGEDGWVLIFDAQWDVEHPDFCEETFWPQHPHRHEDCPLRKFVADSGRISWDCESSWFQWVNMDNVLTIQWGVQPGFGQLLAQDACVRDKSPALKDGNLPWPFNKR